jgi:RecA-family ATPase
MSVVGLTGSTAPAPDVELIIAFVEQLGVPVFPCRPNDKTPVTRHGFKDASKDATQIRRWAAEVRNANWAMPTGAASGIFVLDVDIRPDEGKAGDETLAALEREHGKLPDTATVLTPTNGGMHHWFRLPAGVALTSGTEKLGSGLDVKAEGGYVMLPPSQVDGRAYAFKASGDPGDCGIAEAPAWLVALIAEKRDKPPPEDRGDRAADWIESVRNGNALHDSLRDLAAHYVAKGLGFAEVCRLLEAIMHGSKAPRDERWRERFGEIPKLVNSAIEKYRAAKPEIVCIVGPERARLRSDLFEAPPPPFPFVIESTLPQDVGAEPAAGGVGKTTRHLHESVQIILGRDVWGFKILKPGPIVIVTAEDFRALYEERLYHIVLACNLSPTERKRVLDNIFIEDLVGKDAHLVCADQHGNLRPTGLAEAIVEKYRREGVRLVEFDPLNLFGPGERFVNDGEAATISAARPIAYELKCAVRYTHHVSKAVFRDRIVDMYAGRGGAAGADNQRFVWVSVTHTREDDNAYPPPPGTEEAIAHRRLARIHFAKVSYVPPHLHPIWIERDGFAYRRLEEPVKATAAETTERQLKTLVNFVGAELARGIKHTSRTLEDAKGTIGLSRDTVRATTHEALQLGRLVKVPLEEGKQGSRDYYLRTGRAVSAQWTPE